MSVNTPKNYSFEPIAVVGIGSMFPGAVNAAEFWDNIKQSRDFIRDILPSHWLIEDYYDPDPEAIDKTYCKRGAFLSTIDFDPLAYGIPPSVLPAIDTSQLLALMVAKQTLEDAYGEAYSSLDLSRVSVIIGSSTLEAIQYMSARLQRPVWTKALREQGLPETAIQEICEKIASNYTPLQENTFPGLLQNVIAGRIANRFNLGGTNCVTDAACAGSLAALTMSIRELQSGAADMVITGGVDTLNDIVMYMCFAKTKALSLSGDCSPFSDQADGTVLGEGIGMFALKRLDDAEQHNNRIYGVIRGIGAASDGRSKSIYAPVPEGQAKAIGRAYETAGYSLSTVELLEAHGTGTKAGDLAEFQGVELAFKTAGENRRHICALGSIKSQIGHTKSAAGAAGMFKALMALHHKTLPPTIKVTQPNPAFDLDHSPLYLNTQLRPWVRNAEHPRRASVSSFGFGGSNYHVTLEEYSAKGHRAARLRSFPSEWVVFSGKDTSQLLQQLNACLASFTEQSSLVDIARQTQHQSHAQHAARLAVVAADVVSLRAKLQQALATITAAPDQAISLKQGIYYAAQPQAGKVMFMFPGQGSQYVGMSAELAMAFDECMSAWDNAANIAIDDELALQDVVFPKPGFSIDHDHNNEQRMMNTQWAQPALAVSSLCYLRLLTMLGVNADYLCGHSFGELTALYAGGVMDEQTLILLARKRGELMAEAAQTPGAMLSVFYPSADVLQLLQQQQLTATPANFNAPAQIVLSGTLAEISAAQHYFDSVKIRCQRLPVATGFHSPLVAASCEPLAKFLASLPFKSATLPVFANSSGELYDNKVVDIKDMLAKQLVNPVRFQTQIENAYQRGVRTFIEVGPKNVLTSLVDRCLQDHPHHAIHLDKQGDNGINRLWHALGQMFSIGLDLDMPALWAEYNSPTRSTTPKTKPTFTVKINGTNYAKPYPSSISTKGTAVPAAQPTVETPAIKASVSSTPPTVENTTSQITVSHLAQQQTLTEVNNMSQSNHPYVIQMYQNLQIQLINSHNHYQKIMAESHMAFLQSINQLANQIAGETNLNVVTPPVTTGFQLNSQQPMMEQPLTVPMVMVAPTYSNGAMANGMMTAAAATPMAAVAPMVSAPTPQPTKPLFQPPPVVAAAPQPVAHATVTPPPAAAASSADLNLEALLLDVVVETTGYPKEMLNMGMSIEADLGIDSIKRVEILSILVERAPNLPQVDPADLGKLETLGDIISYMQQRQK